MRRGTTPTVTLTVTNEDETPLDLTGKELHVTFDDGRRQLTKRETDDGVTVEVDGDATIVEIALTQEETLMWREGGTVRVQVRVKGGGSAAATDIASFQAEEILLEGVI